MGWGGNASGWTALDSGDGTSLCAVSVRTAVRGGQRPRVLAAAERPWPAEGQPPGPAQAQALRELLGHMDRHLPLLLTLSRGQYRLRVVAEPAVSPRELLAGLRWSLAAEGDEAPDDLSLAWMPIPAGGVAPARPTQGYAVMASSQWLAARMAAWRQAGVRPSVVDIRETALRNIAAAVEQPGESVALVHADAQGINMVFTFQGSLFLDRHIEQPLAEISTAEPSVLQRVYERIAVQLMRSIDVMGHSYSLMPRTRVVVAPMPAHAGLPEFLAAQLPLRTQPLALEQVFDLDAVPALAQSPALQARCLVALGATLRGAKGPR